MEFRCLGTLEAMMDSSPVDLGEPQQRLALAVLLSHDGAVVSTDRLVDDIWGDDSPQSARKIVQGYVSALRKALGPDNGIESRPPGYRLQVHRSDVDSNRFVDLVLEAGDKMASDPDRARAAVREALLLWRGSPYEDLSDHDSLRPEIVRLESMHMTANELRIEADIYAGDSSLATAELADLTQRHPLRERLWALRMLALYRTGRQAEALRVFDEARRVLAEDVGLEPSPELRLMQQRILDQEPILATTRALSNEQPHDVTAWRNPYKGLRPFEEDDAADFYGREAATRRLFEALTRRDVQRLLVLAGPSGSGKSSLVRAGLFPVLRRDGWRLASLFPGAGDIANLDTALEGLAGDGPGAILVDQLEELYSPATTDDVRTRFLDRISDIVEAADGPWIVVTVRTDFLDRFLTHHRLARLVGPALVLVTPFEAHEVRDIVTRPASLVGTAVDAELTGAIVADVSDRSAHLPLLEFALTDLYDRSGGKALTLDAYRAAGGISGSLIKRAEELYEGLGPDAKRATHQLFLQLVSLTDDDEPIRRRRATSATADIGGVADVLDLFGRHRLLTFDRDTAGEPTVEVAHESLLTHWPRLAEWIAAATDSIRTHRQLTDATNEWEDSQRSDAYLLIGTRLMRFGDQTTTDLALSMGEREFLERSRLAHRRSRKRRTAVVWSLVVVFAALAAVAQWQRSSAVDEARQATVRRVAGESTLALAEDPELGILLALEAVNISRRAGEAPLREAIAALHLAVQTSRLEARIDGGALSVAFSADGSLLVTDTPDPDSGWPTNEVVVWDAATRSPLRSLVADVSVLSLENRADGGAEGRAFAFSPDGTVLAVAYQADPGGGMAPIILWNPHTGAQISRLTTPGWVAWDPTWSADGARLTAASWDGTTDTVTTWDVASGTQVSSFAPGFVGGLATYRDDTIAIAQGPRERVGIYDTNTGEEIDAMDTPGLAPVDIAIDLTGDRMVLDGRHGFLQMWDVASKSRQWSRPISSSRTLALSPDGTTIAVGGNEGLVRLLDLDTGADVIVLNGPAGVASIAFDPTSDVLATTHVSGARLWNVSTTGSPALGAIEIESGRPFMIDFSLAGSEILVSTWDQTFERRATNNGLLLGATAAVWTDPGVHPVVSADWSAVAFVSDAGLAQVHSLVSGVLIRELPDCMNPRALSPSGSVVVLDGWWLCEPGSAPPDIDLRSKVIDVVSGDEILNLGDQNIFRAAFNPGGSFEPGRYVALNYNAIDGEGVAIDGVDVFDTVTGELVFSLDISPTMIGFDPTGRYLAAGTYEGRVTVVDVAAVVGGSSLADSIIMDTQVATSLVSGVALTVDGLLATAASESTFLRMWDIHTGTLVMELRTDFDGAAPPRLAFSPDGTYLLYPSANNVLRRFLTNTDSLVALAQSRVTRALTSDECLRYLDTARCP